jgi:hypothetical protein
MTHLGHRSSVAAVARHNNEIGIIAASVRSVLLVGPSAGWKAESAVEVSLLRDKLTRW